MEEAILCHLGDSSQSFEQCLAQKDRPCGKHLSAKILSMFLNMSKKNENIYRIDHMNDEMTLILRREMAK